MKITSVVTAMVLAFVSATAAVAQDKPDVFVAAAAQANTAEIEASKLALQKSRNARVRDFARRMVDDHTKTGNLLAVVAKQEHIPLPDGLDADHSAKIADLTARTTDFDSAYVAMMVADHAAAVSLFSDYAATGEDPYLKRFAQNTLPKLKAHKASVDRLQAKR